MLSHFEYSNIGGCDKNDDSVGAAVKADNGVFVVADGLGGHRFGDVASKFVVGGFLECDIDTASKLETVFRGAQLGLIKLHGEYPGARTTAAVLAINGGQAIWGHVGDSRLYYFSGGRLAAFTADQSVSYKKYSGGQITHNEIAQDEDRSSLLCVLGGDRSEPNISGEIPLSPGDAFLLCTDGFWEYLNDEELLIDLLKSDTPRRWAEYMLLRHIRRTRRGNDNFSLITVFVG
ncbi:MAG: serine/threonine-protein phosphatase [Oscillospiraceae bacterium]|jgi:serine/threonine protein phosphatase PrpC|nr:serine/threonine-protein phosphatase [Oscillospiraceae bacterium]